MKVKSTDGRTYNLKLKRRIPKVCSKGHLRARALLKELFPIDILYEEVSIKGGLRLDFFAPKLKLVIEVDGRQHTNYVEHFHKSKINFYKCVQNDIAKNDWCEVNGFTLIRLEDKENNDEWRCRILEIYRCSS